MVKHKNLVIAMIGLVFVRLIVTRCDSGCKRSAIALFCVVLFKGRALLLILARVTSGGGTRCKVGGFFNLINFLYQEAFELVELPGGKGGVKLSFGGEIMP